LPAGTNWNFDVHWYSKIPGVISASSFDGKIGIYNIKVHKNWSFIFVAIMWKYILAICFETN
jgi:predicted RNase H-like nuclease